MLSLKCTTCGGEMSVDGSGLLRCDYCGCKRALDDNTLLKYRDFRLELLNFLRGLKDQNAHGDGQGHNEDVLWDNAETVQLKREGGGAVTIRSLYSRTDSGVTVYLTRKSILYQFSSDSRRLADKMTQALSLLEFPPADMKGLRDCFPTLIGQYALEGGGSLIAYERPEHIFPLSMFGALTPEHAAWVISRLENICCVLEYSGLVHGGISEHSVWINPFTHHAVLHGNWWGAQKKGRGHGSSPDLRDLKDIRKTAERILGLHKPEAPEQMRDFLSGSPAEDAYADFKLWDQVIQNGFGGRRFAKMDVGF